MYNSLRPHGLQHTRIPALHHLTAFVDDAIYIMLCHALSSCPQSFPASGSFPMSQLLALGGQSIAASMSASGLPIKIQGWFPLRLTGLISLLSKQLSRVFSSTTIWKHQFFGSQLSLWSNCNIHTWLLEKPWLWLYGPLSTNSYCCF